MKQLDYSREIFENYYNTQGHLLVITLKDGTVLEGIFIGFFHGDEGSNDPYIIKWHFLPESKVEKHYSMYAVDESEEYGMIIKQEDIKNVRFKL